jgi:hypothetical protein
LLTDNKRLQPVERVRRRKDRGWYGDSQKIEAVQMYLMIGSMPPVAAALKIDMNTLNKWRYTEWWRELTAQIKQEGRVKLNGRLQKIVSKSLDVLEDRLENGDFQYDPKTGEMIRKPIAARDALRISTDFIDKTVKLDSVTREEQNDQAVEDRLKTLADAFASFASKTKRVEVEDAVQIESPKRMDVFEHAQDGEEVGIGDPEEQEIAGEEGWEEVTVCSGESSSDSGTEDIFLSEEPKATPSPDSSGRTETNCGTTPP